jgi:hypothetical protein
MSQVPLEQLSAERLIEFVGSTFSVEANEGHKVPLLLTTVTQPRTSGSAEPGVRYENFSLFFDGPSAHPLPQRTYTMEHLQLGHFTLFIVPVGNERGCLQYQIVFNRLRKEV